ncbi:hypothetical protein Q1695_009328 [Nippostrongylus brasiliensis]|nr:hypothetical protein Q1695_009328 [Nippostrongylus brasiliensis]
MLSLKNALLLLAVVCGLALECYKGSKYMKGQSIGTEKMTCEKETDYCYNMTADLTQFNALSRSGCSTNCVDFTIMCMSEDENLTKLAHNKCIKQTLFGKSFEFCCCNTGNLCNSKLTNLSKISKAKERVKGFLKIFE